MNKKILITGANGFIGQCLVNYLSGKGYFVLAMIRKGSIPGFDFNKNVEIVYGDLTDINSLENCIQDGCAVVNLAANQYHPKMSYEVNVDGVSNLISVCEKKKVTKLVQISSQSTKIKNKGVYSKTKIEGDKLISNSKLNWTILKPSLVYGEGEKGLFNKIKILVEKLPFLPIFGNGKASVSPVHVEDLCQIIESIIINQKDNKSVYDIGCPTSVSYNDLYVGILKYLNKKNLIIHVPVFIGLMAGKFFEILKLKNPPFYIDNVLGSTQKTNCNSEKVIKKYGIKPREFENGLKDVFIKNNIRVGVVGLGKMGLLHLSVLSAIKEVEIVALIDTNKQLFSTVKSMGVSGDYFDNVDESIKQKKIDVLFILTPTFTHIKLLMKAIKKGINVFVEKPLALNEEEISKLSMDLKKYKVKVGVGYTLLYKRTINKIKEIIESKKYGEIVEFNATYEHGEVLGKKKGWMFEKSKSGGGVLMNPGPHLFAVVNYLFGKPNKIDGTIKSIYSTDLDDEANINLSFDDFKGKMFLSWSVKGQNILKLNIVIKFKNGVLETDGKKIKIIAGGKEIIMMEEDIPPISLSSFNINPEANGEAYYIEDKMFIESVKTEKPFLSDFKFAMETESIIHEIYKINNNKL
jgi:predicted dehydrogenase/nucleoside-diphosphate-sugar epimerase